MAGRHEDLPDGAAAAPITPTAPTGAAWFAWGWVLLVVLAAAAELLDLERLRLALDLAHVF